MITMMTPREFWLTAAQWGSYLTSSDPGVCMYGFDEHGLVQSEKHRQCCINWIENHCRWAADMNENPDEDHAQLDEMLAYLKSAPVLE